MANDLLVSKIPLMAPSILRRMACACYEALLMFGVVWLAAYLFGALSQTRHAMENRLPLQAFLFLIFGIYFTWFWSRGQTLAMKTWHIKLVDQHGKLVTQWKAFLRYLATWLWFVPPLLMVWIFHLNLRVAAIIFCLWFSFWIILIRFNSRRQFMHDVLVGTFLISSSDDEVRMGVINER